MKVVRLSALSTDRLYPLGNTPGTHSCYKLSPPQGHSAAGRILSIKNFNNTIGNRTSDLPTCSAVPQPTALPLNLTPIDVVFMVDEAALVQVFLRVLPTTSVSIIGTVLNDCPFFHSSTIDAIQY